MATTKNIKVVWNDRGQLLPLMRDAVVASYKNNEPLSEDVADLITYRIFETQNEVRLIIEFI